MRVLIIAPTPYFSDRGCHIRIFEEWRALVAAGHAATVYTYHLGRDVGPGKIQRIKSVDSYRKTSAGPAWTKLYLDWLLYRKIRQSVRPGEFDIIHAHLHEGTAIGWLVAHWLKIPLVADWQSVLTEELKSYHWLPFGLRHIVQWFEGWLGRKADWIFVSAPRALDILRELHPALTDKTELLLDGVHALQPHPAEWPVPEVITIVYAGGMGEAKGVPVLIEALEQLVERGGKFKVLLIGQMPTSLQDRLASGPLQGRIEHITQVPYDQLITVLQRADIGVDPKPPTSTESSGKILNYMAAGLVTVAFASPTTRQLLDSSGVLVETPTAEALARQLEKIIQYPEDLWTWREDSYRRVKKEFLWSALFSAVVQRYAKLIK